MIAIRSNIVGNYRMTNEQANLALKRICDLSVKAHFELAHGHLATADALIHRINCLAITGHDYEDRREE